jgi:hypothetical protein
MREVESVDKAIDELVYELYGLTEEEIGIVENCPPSRPSPKSKCGFGGRGMRSFYENSNSHSGFCFIPPPFPFFEMGEAGGG